MIDACAVYETLIHLFNSFTFDLMAAQSKKFPKNRPPKEASRLAAKNEMLADFFPAGKKKEATESLLQKVVLFHIKIFGNFLSEFLVCLLLTCFYFFHVSIFLLIYVPKLLKR